MSDEKLVKLRLNKYDNLRGLAIILVVFGHFCFLTNFFSIKLARNFVYMFHLPVLFFISGYFSKTDINHLEKSVKRLLIPYFLFCILYYVFILIIGQKGSILFINPGYSLWFLISLFTMKLILPFFIKLKYPILVSFILAIGTCFIGIPSNILGISRTFVYLPIFLIGFYYKNYENVINLLKSNNYNNFDNDDVNYETKLKYQMICLFGKIVNNKKILYFLLVLALIFSIIIAWNFSRNIIEFKIFTTFDSALKIITVIILQNINALLLVIIMTNNKTVITKIGYNSMAIYVLHIFFLKIIEKYMIFYLQSINEFKILIFAIIISLVLSYILSRDFITYYLNKLTDRIYNFIMK